MNLHRIQARLQSILDELRTSVPVRVEIEGIGIAVHYGLYLQLGPDTDWAGLIVALDEIDRDEDPDIRWDQAVEVLEEHG